MLPKPYYSDGQVTLYLGDCREIMPALQADAVITDPPYGDTSLEWDRWPMGWPHVARSCSSQLWCFGSLRMFTDKWVQFEDWTYAQEIIWEKHNGSSLANDRFRRVHELAVHFYHGDWASIHKEPQFTYDATARTVKRKKQRPQHWGRIDPVPFSSEDGGPRLMTSVMAVRSCHGHAVHPTQKPEGIVTPLLLYSVPAGGTVLDPFAGSGTTLVAARKHGMRAIGIEARVEYCRIAVDRLAQRELIA